MILPFIASHFFLYKKHCSIVSSPSTFRWHKISLGRRPPEDTCMPPGRPLRRLTTRDKRRIRLLTWDASARLDAAWPSSESPETTLLDVRVYARLRPARYLPTSEVARSRLSWGRIVILDAFTFQTTRQKRTLSRFATRRSAIVTVPPKPQALPKRRNFSSIIFPTIVIIFMTVHMPITSERGVAKEIVSFIPFHPDGPPLIATPTRTIVAPSIPESVAIAAPSRVVPPIVPKTAVVMMSATEPTTSAPTLVAERLLVQLRVQTAATTTPTWGAGTVGFAALIPWILMRPTTITLRPTTRHLPIVQIRLSPIVIVPQLLGL